MDEDQFVLRLPPSLAPRLRLALASKAKRDAAVATEAPTAFSIAFTSQRAATFTLDGEAYPATLMDLPCVAETHKYTEKRTFYKSGDVGQMLVVRLPGEPDPGGGEEWILADGITPGAMGARERFRMPEPIFKAEQVSQVENTLKLVVDNKMSFVKKKVDGRNGGEASGGGGGGRGGGGGGAGGREDEIEIEIDGDAEKKEKEKGEPRVVVAAAVVPAATPEPSPSPSPSLPPELSPSPLPGGEGGVEAEEDVEDEVGEDDEVDDDDDDDDDFANMLAESMLEDGAAEGKAAGEARIARVAAERRVAEKMGEVAEQEAAAARAANPVVKGRIMKRVAELKAELQKLQDELAAI